MRLTLSPSCLSDYDTFLRVKALPRFDFIGRTAVIPDEYAKHFGKRARQTKADYSPSPFMFDYQRDIARLAVEKRKFAVFAQPGLGKTIVYLDYIRHVLAVAPDDSCALILCPLMVVNQTIEECAKFYDDKLPIEKLRGAALQDWLISGTSRLGISNFESLSAVEKAGRLACLVVDESSIMKSHYGIWGSKIIELGAGLDWKLAGTGTPAPNDRIEYANHAVYLDRCPTINAFLARFFVNRGQTDNRWELKPHALKPFYRSLSDWCIFLNNPATYGWKDNVGNIPPIHVHIHDVSLTKQQRDIAFEETGRLFASDLGGITGRSKLGQLAKGNHNGEAVPTNKTDYIKSLVASWPDESTIIWCLYNAEQEALERAFPEAVSLKGSTSDDERERMIHDFKSGKARVLISKPKILGFGLNLQIATRQIFSGLQDSYEQFYQAVKRSNRIGSTKPLNVHIPVTEIERPMIDTVLRKAHRVELDTAEQEELFAKERA